MSEGLTAQGSTAINERYCINTKNDPTLEQTVYALQKEICDLKEIVSAKSDRIYELNELIHKLQDDLINVGLAVSDLLEYRKDEERRIIEAVKRNNYNRWADRMIEKFREEK